MSSILLGVHSPHSQAQPTFRDLLRTRLVEQDTVPPDAADRTDLVFNLTKFFNRLGQDAESVHRRLGWSWAGFRFMNLLWAAGPIEARQLTRLSGASRAATSAVLNTLERDGLIRRDRSETDRRQVLVSLTDEGTSRLLEGLRAQAERDRAWFAVLSPEEQRQLGHLLMRLADQPTP
ncbi:MarR family transcriptional regulator [Streptomyces hirsutus]